MNIENKMIQLTQELVQSLFTYSDGNLYWKKSTSKFSNIKIGDRAGSLHHTGYYIIQIYKNKYSAHRLIFLYHKGYLLQFIDHIDNNSLNNKIENLRGVTQQQNNMNAKKCQNTSSQYKGVSWHKKNKKWQTYINIDGKRKYLGYFNNEIDAALIYNEKAKELFGEYAYLNGV